MFLLTLKEQLVTKKSGFALLEVMLSAALFLIITSFAVQAFLYGEEAAVLSGERQRAALYAEEGLEALRNISDAAFTNLSIGGPYGVSTSTGSWSISGTSNTDGEFIRQILIGSNGTDRLVATSTVTWNQNAQRSGSFSLVTYLTNWAKSGIGNWSLPSIETGYAAVPTTSGVDVTVFGDYAYVVLVSGTPNFLVVNISSTTNPVLTGSATLVANLSNVIVSGNYAYVTGTGNANELQIVNITNKAAPALVGTFNAAGNSDAYGSAISGNYVYFVRALSATNGQNEFEVVNVSNPALPTSAGVLNLEATAQDIRVVGNYAYIASQDDIREFQIIDITNPALPVRTAVINIIGAATATNGRAIMVNSASTVAFLSRMDAIVYPINITSKTVPVLLAANGWSTGGSAQGMVLFNNDTYLALANTLTSGELRIFDVTNPTTPTQLSVMDISGTTSNFNTNGIDYSPTYDRLYLAGARFVGSSNRQLVITKPQ
ncbi:MAG: hypothetical protein ACOYL8_00715 [Patescibacteria group bacterium]